MKIQTLKDMKIALNSIPDSVLDKFGVGPNEDGEITLLVWADDESDAMKLWEKWEVKYPKINDISKWIEKIIEASDIEDIDDLFDSGEPISSESNLRRN